MYDEPQFWSICQSDTKFTNSLKKSSIPECFGTSVFVPVRSRPYWYKNRIRNPRKKSDFFFGPTSKFLHVPPGGVNNNIGSWTSIRQSSVLSWSYTSTRCTLLTSEFTVSERRTFVYHDIVWLMLPNVRAHYMDSVIFTCLGWRWLILVSWKISVWSTQIDRNMSI